MSILILSIAIFAAQLMIVIAMAIASIRLFHGPRAQDRIVALDCLYASAMILLLTFGIETARIVYFEAALIIGMLGFVSTVALAKFLMRGEVIE
ncbi:K+/H+ antiporter subunit F [Oryzifoliimicrobium ureilyticus]|uniref:K+/H+ antiporter subunit F n=1 Tax=Oryzifoliimicrobium ureilyticus TaxID=3113724 RepID=UPI0030766B33